MSWANQTMTLTAEELVSFAGENVAEAKDSVDVSTALASALDILLGYINE